jgi:GxxExxY protein
MNLPSYTRNYRENELATLVLDAAFKIHRSLGPSLLESAYKECLFCEVKRSGLEVRKEVPLPLIYEEVKLECGYRADLIIENKLIAEVKSVNAISDLHLAQILTYQRLAKISLGLLMNFNVPLLKQGIKRSIPGKLEEPLVDRTVSH